MSRFGMAACLAVVVAAFGAQGQAQEAAKYVGAWGVTEDGEVVEVMELLPDRTAIVGDDTPNGKWVPLPDNRVNVIEVTDGKEGESAVFRLVEDRLVFEIKDDEGKTQEVIRLKRLSPEAVKAIREKRKTESRRHACQNGQRIVESAVEQWAIVENVAEGAAVVEKEVLAYIKNGVAPTCPVADKPIALPAKLGDPVRCPGAIPEHDLNR